MKYNIMAWVENWDQERVARSFETKEEAVKALNKAFKKSVNGVWTDSFGQHFRIEEIEEV